MLDTPTESYGLYFTVEELEALDDLKRDLRKQFGLKVTKRALMRHALHELAEDYYGQKAACFIVRRLQNARERENERTR